MEYRAACQLMLFLSVWLCVHTHDLRKRSIFSWNRESEIRDAETPVQGYLPMLKVHKYNGIQINPIHGPPVYLENPTAMGSAAAVPPNIAEQLPPGQFAADDLEQIELLNRVATFLPEGDRLGEADYNIVLPYVDLISDDMLERFRQQTYVSNQIKEKSKLLKLIDFVKYVKEQKLKPFKYVASVGSSIIHKKKEKLAAGAQSALGLLGLGSSAPASPPASIYSQEQPIPVAYAAPASPPAVHYPPPSYATYTSYIPNSQPSMGVSQYSTMNSPATAPQTFVPSSGKLPPQFFQRTPSNNYNAAAYYLNEQLPPAIPSFEGNELRPVPAFSSVDNLTSENNNYQSYAVAPPSKNYAPSETQILSQYSRTSGSPAADQFSSYSNAQNSAHFPQTMSQPNFNSHQSQMLQQLANYQIANQAAQIDSKKYAIPYRVPSNADFTKYYPSRVISNADSTNYQTSTNEAQFGTPSNVYQMQMPSQMPFDNDLTNQQKANANQAQSIMNRMPVQTPAHTSLVSDLSASGSENLEEIGGQSSNQENKLPNTFVENAKFDSQKVYTTPSQTTSFAKDFLKYQNENQAMPVQTPAYTSSINDFSAASGNVKNVGESTSQENKVPMFVEKEIATANGVRENIQSTEKILLNELAPLALTKVNPSRRTTLQLVKSPAYTPESNEYKKDTEPMSTTFQSDNTTQQKSQ